MRIENPRVHQQGIRQTPAPTELGKRHLEEMLTNYTFHNPVINRHSKEENKLHQAWKECQQKSEKHLLGTA